MLDRRLLSLAKESRRHLLAHVAWRLLGLVGELVCALTLAQALASLIEKSAISPLLICAQLLLAALLKLASLKMAAAAHTAAAAELRASLRGALYRKMLRLGSAFAKQARSPELEQLALEGIELMQSYYTSFLPQLVFSLVALCALSALLAAVYLPAAIVLFVSALFSAPLVLWAARAYNTASQLVYEEQTAASSLYYEKLAGLTTLKLYQADEAYKQKMQEEAKLTHAAVMAASRAQLLPHVLRDLLWMAGTALAVVALAVGMAFEAFSQGSTNSFSAMLVLCVSLVYFAPLRQLAAMLPAALEARRAKEAFFELIALDEPPARPISIRAGDHLFMRRASLAKPELGDPIKKVTIDIPAVGLTAIVGEQGSGASTVAALLSGVCREYQGDVLIGGKQLRNIAAESLARYVTLLPAKSQLFEGTVRENLQLADPQATELHMWSVLAATDLADFLREGEGLTTRVDRDGKNFTEGQRRRLALARALLNNSAVYIFDEVESTLDAESEAIIMGAVRSLARYKACVLITRRLAHAAAASSIYVMDKGCVVEQGTHEQLLAAGGYYRQLWEAEKQAGALTLTKTQDPPKERALEPQREEF